MVKFSEAPSCARDVVPAKVIRGADDIGSISRVEVSFCVAREGASRSYAVGDLDPAGRTNFHFLKRVHLGSSGR
jgi:hypothetical protein